MQGSSSLLLLCIQLKVAITKECEYGGQNEITSNVHLVKVVKRKLFKTTVHQEIIQDNWTPPRCINKTEQIGCDTHLLP